MRRNLVVVLVAVAAVAICFLRPTRDVLTPSDPTFEAVAPQVVDEKAAELALAPASSTESRAVAATDVVVPATVETAATPGAHATTSDSRLLVHVRARESVRPLAGVQVALFNVDTPFFHVTDANGDVELACPSGVDLELYVDGGGRAANHNELVAALSAGEARRITVLLATTDDVQYFGRVLRWSDRAPIPGAAVTVVAESDPNSLQHRAGKPRVSTPLQVDADGLFELHARSWLSPCVRVAADGFGVAFAFVEKGHQLPDMAQEILLQRSATLECVVTGLADAEDARVEVSADAYALMQPRSDYMYKTLELDDERWTAELSSDGRARLEVPAQSLLEAALVVGGKTVRKHPQPISIAPDETRTIEFRLGPGCRIRGRVVDASGVVVPDKDVQLIPAPTARPFVPQLFFGEVTRTSRSAADGTFTFEDVDPGRWGIALAQAKPSSKPMVTSASACASVAQLVEIADGDEERSFELVVHCGLFVSGKVIDTDGHGAKHAALFGEIEGVDGAITCNSDENGRFALGPLPAGAILITLPFDRLLDPRDGARVRAGDTDVVLRVAKNGSLRGQVVDTETGAGRLATVRYQEAADPDATSKWFESADDGRFDSESVPVGAYHVSAVTSDGRIGIVRDVRVAVDAPAVRIPVALGGRVRVLHRASEGSAFVVLYADGVLVESTRVAANGVEELLVPIGPIEVRWHRGEAASWRERLPLVRVDRVEVTAGAVQEVVFESAK